ncbi:MAG: hypothetical protein Q8P32_00100 [Candidatus Komeilibacteria bacterium]|nr:hypothetical protein [Candidatus Komeilibacteria bacterium]
MLKLNKTRNVLTIGGRLLADGLAVAAIDNKKYQVRFPKKIFAAWPTASKNFFLDNYVYARTRTLAMIAGADLRYFSNRPFLENFIHQGIKQDLRIVSELDKYNTRQLLSLFPAKITFKSDHVISRLPKKSVNRPDRVIMALSFGKDSLLSYALAKEIGLQCFPVMCNIMEKYNYQEWLFKKKIFADFIKQENQPSDLFSDNVDDIFFSPALSRNIEELHCANSMLTYALEMMPFADYYRARYIVFGNERNFDDYFINKDGYKTYPSYDQYSGYTSKLNKELKIATHDNTQIISLIEPLYNLAEMHILFNRYPDILKYLMSCYPEKPGDKWCYQCPMCAKAFLYSVAVGGDPFKIGMKKNLFNAASKDLYPLFAAKISRPYEKPVQVKEEQMLSFLLAYRCGWKGPLIDLFKKQYLTKAKRAEKKMRARYFGIHNSQNLPQSIKSPLVKIYQQELRDLV